MGILRNLGYIRKFYQFSLVLFSSRKDVYYIVEVLEIILLQDSNLFLVSL